MLKRPVGACGVFVDPAEDAVAEFEDVHNFGADDHTLMAWEKRFTRAGRYRYFNNILR